MRTTNIDMNHSVGFANYKLSIAPKVDAMGMTADQVREKFKREGKSLSSWAKENGFNPQRVYLVVGGQVKGHFGTGHKIAVALGMKEAA